jgi:aminoglycoside phosphotransferase family enzyme/predicted kinase
MPPRPDPQTNAGDPEQVRGADPDQVRAAVARISAGATGEPGVDVLETHISYVFLTPERAYKLKKPLVLPFLDYGTPQRRRKLCSEEVRLNRRLAGDLYTGVRALIPRPDGLELADEDHPDAIDYLVEMRRYDARDTMAAVLDRGKLTGGQIRELARQLAGFHARCPPGADGLRHDAQGVGREVQRNVEELLGVAASRAQRRRIRALAMTMSAFVGAHEETLDARCADRRTRECHGDLRSEHVVLGPPIRVVDCVEFDLGLRTLDVADDLAFLVMDLTRLGGESYAGELVAAYRQAGGDCGDDALLAFFAVHRALVRAKVMLVWTGQQAPESPAHVRASAEARDLLALAERFAWRTRMPMTIVVCGVPASGKSHLVGALAAASGLHWFSSDRVRKDLAGIGSRQRGSPQHYGDEFNRATYAELGRLAASEIAGHGGTIIDATFRHRADRDAFRASFARAAPLLFVQCVCPVSVLARRAVTRQGDPASISDASLEVVMSERDRFDPLDEVPGADHIVLRSDLGSERMLAQLSAMLDLRGAPT